MIKYYTRACNFYYGRESKEKIKQKMSLPLNGKHFISFDEIEIISRKSIKRVSIKKIKHLPKIIKKKIIEDIKNITKKKKIQKYKFQQIIINHGCTKFNPR